MAAGQVTATGAVSYLGELFQTSRRPNQLLRLLGGLQGGLILSSSRTFPVGVYFDLAAPSQPAVLEGDVAPAAEHRILTQTENVIQIFHKKVDLSYLATAENAVTGVVPLPQAAAQGSVINPRDESTQIMWALEGIAQDANYSFLRGAYASPANPSTVALRTRGIHTAISTNVVDHSGAAAPDTTTMRSYVEELMRTIIASNGYSVDDSWTAFCDAIIFNNAAAAYEGLTGIPLERTIAGLQIRVIRTRMGDLNLVLEPDMPADTLDIFNLRVVGIVGLPVPGKGVLFEEPLARVGSSDATQIYGHLGLDHGPEFCHGSLLLAAGITAL
jgi:hypothetical protein